MQREAVCRSPWKRREASSFFWGGGSERFWIAYQIDMSVIDNIKCISVAYNFFFVCRRGWMWWGWAPVRVRIYLCEYPWVISLHLPGPHQTFNEILQNQYLLLSPYVYTLSLIIACITYIIYSWNESFNSSLLVRWILTCTASLLNLYLTLAARRYHKLIFFCIYDHQRTMDILVFLCTGLNLIRCQPISNVSIIQFCCHPLWWLF